MTTYTELAAEKRDSGTLSELYPVAVRNEVELTEHRAVPVAALKPGDRVDLEDDPYADENAADDDVTSEHLYEYAVVESVVAESPGCVVVHTSAASFACPPHHTVPVLECDICEGRGYFTNPGPSPDSLVVTRCDTCDRFEGDEAAARHAAKLRGWSVMASALTVADNLAPIEEGSVLVSDGEVPALAWIADTIRADDSSIADGYTARPMVVRFVLERLP